MIIQSLKHNYSVVQKVKSCGESIGYRCTDKEEVPEGEYHVILLRNNGKKPELLEYFSEMIFYHQDFRDLHECFQNHNQLYIVFEYNEGKLLNDRLRKEQYGLYERIRIGKALFEEMILQNMPYYFLWEGLRKENVVLTDSMDLRFRYTLSDIENHAGYSISDVCKSFDSWMQRLFSKEIKSRGCDELTLFRRALKNAEFKTYMEIYEAFLQVYKELMNLHETGMEIQPYYFVYRSMEGIKIFYKKINTLLGILVLCILAAAAVYLISYKKNNTGETEKGISRIGTVEIGNQKENIPDPEGETGYGTFE